MAALRFYATVTFDKLRRYMPSMPYLLPASSWARGMKNGVIPAPNLPIALPEVAADSGGFVATFKWGDYRYTPAQYVDWLTRWPVAPSWAATMDYCCENEITAGKPGIVRERQQRTSDMAAHFWQEYLAVAWCWVPTIQGWTVEDYRRHAREMRPLITAMQKHYAGDPRFRVGIGTLCGRADTNMVHQVVRAVVEELPGIPLHLWGVKLNVLKSATKLPAVVSVDSAAWHPGGLKRDGAIAKHEAQAMGLTQMAHAYLVALKRYQAKVEHHLTTPKQLSLWEVV